MITQFIHHVKQVQVLPPECTAASKGNPAYYTQRIRIVLAKLGEESLVEIHLFADKHANLLSPGNVPA